MCEYSEKYTEKYELHANGTSLGLIAYLDHEVIQKFISKKCNILRIEFHSSGYENLHLLENYVTTLFIDRDDLDDLSFVYSLKNIKKLGISGSKIKNLDFSKLPHLEILSLGHVKLDLRQIINCKNLKELNLTSVALENYKEIAKVNQLYSLCLNGAKNWEPDFFDTLTNLEYLTIYRSKATDCSFLKQCTKLKAFMMAYCPNLINLKGLPSSLIEEITIAACKDFYDLELEGGYPLINWLNIDSCPNVKTINPLMEANNLVTLELRDRTSVADGKIKQVLALPKLEVIAFKNRKHYDISVKDANDYLEARTLQNKAR